MTLAVGCSKSDDPQQKDENPFDGIDNHITSFVIKSGGETYVGTIKGENINITVPVNTSLKDAKVEYTLCEQATIMPNPAEVTDWSSDQSFRVKSYKGETRDYTYSVVWSDISHEGNILLLTQADVDAFAKTGSTIIDGNLIIGSAAKADPETAIVSLEGLKSVKEVKSQIIINNSFSGTDLKGLENIERCAGFYIGNSSTVVTFGQDVSVSMPALKVTGDLILNSNMIKSISMPKLTSAGTILIASQGLESLAIPALKEIAGDLAIKCPSNAANTVLTEAEFPELSSVGGSMFLQYFSGITTAEFPKLVYIGSNLDVQLNAASLEELNFPNLETVNVVNLERAPGILTVNIPKVKQVTSFLFNKVSYGTYPLKKLDLSSLEKIDNEFYLRGVSNMEEVSLPKLQSVGGDMTLWDLKLMSALKMPEVNTIKGKLYLSSANILTSLDLSKVTNLGAIELVGCLKLAEIKSPKEVKSITVNFAANATCPMPVFDGLETVSEKLSLTSCGNSTNIDIKNIKNIKSFQINDIGQNGVLTISDATEMGTLDIGTYKMAEFNAPKLAKVENLKLSNIWVLTTIHIPALKTVLNFSLAEHGSWNASNAKMTNLDAFAGITSMESVKIEYCAKLSDFSGLSQVISTLPEDKWSVSNCKYNPTYRDMAEGRFTE